MSAALEKKDQVKASFPRRALPEASVVTQGRFLGVEEAQIWLMFCSVLLV